MGESYNQAVFYCPLDFQHANCKIMAIFQLKTREFKARTAEIYLSFMPSLDLTLIFRYCSDKLVFVCIFTFAWKLAKGNGVILHYIFYISSLSDIEMQNSYCPSRSDFVGV